MCLSCALRGRRHDPCRCLPRGLPRPLPGSRRHPPLTGVPPTLPLAVGSGTFPRWVACRAVPRAPR
ncbi:hypothetical protein SBRY_30124 [Actinacidiphila bryophytorum]|uniref:Uncharacterized protein n=1 Tax=Actinacidiphila bryophytorum TaxID=1436133 RepID=A0A9W4MEG0_9ACTN|nr:hypothetical protein SBRY_30124 [Actinacidiphila bryophytorum]